MAAPALPTYRTAASALEGDKGAGLRLLGWTVMRTLLIAPPMMIVGCSTKKAWLGAMGASALISVFTLLRIFDARATGLAGVRPPPAARAVRRRR